MIRKINQRNGEDCSVAACAMLAGVSYKRMFKALFPKAVTIFPIDGTSITHEIRALRSLNCSIRVRKYSVRMTRTEYFLERNLKHPAIIGYHHFLANEWWQHCVVWDPEDGIITDPSGIGTQHTIGYIARHMTSSIELLASPREIKRYTKWYAELNSELKPVFCYRKVKHGRS